MHPICEVERINPRRGDDQSLQVLVNRNRPLGDCDWKRVSEDPRARYKQYRCRRNHRGCGLGDSTRSNMILRVSNTKLLHVLRRDPRDISIPIIGVSGARRSTAAESKQPANTALPPMPRHIAEPLDATGLIVRIRRVLHAVASFSSARISPSSVLMSASITSSARGGS